MSKTAEEIEREDLETAAQRYCKYEAHEIMGFEYVFIAGYDYAKEIMYTPSEVSAIIKQVLDEAAERAKTKDDYHRGRLVDTYVDKSSITNIDIEAKYLKK